MSRSKGYLVAVLLPLLSLPACDDDEETSKLLVAGSAPREGEGGDRALWLRVLSYDPVDPGADALVGPPLDRIASRTYIAGVMENTRENMVRWVKDPPGVDPLTAMPNLRVTDDDARDIAAFLYTLR